MRAFRASPDAAHGDDAVVWHDVECGAYEADLALWRELADEAQGPVLELGAGTGRVALHLARRGAGEVTALDSDPTLIAALAGRARRQGVTVSAEVADARSFRLERRFALVIAPMQVVQLLGGVAGRRALLEAVRAHLLPGGRLAIALADPLEGLPVAEVTPPLPDVREEAGWVYSSRPVAVHDQAGAVVIERIREAVSPGGELQESATTVRLDPPDPAGLEDLGRSLGFAVLPRRRIPATDAYVGSDVVVMEAP
jgi:SAM-dependent methyltransferase